MTITIEKANLSGEIPAIPSKSAAHRALICAALAKNPTKLYRLPNSKDIDATCGCLTAMGAAFSDPEFRPITHVQDAVLDCGESGSTLRFLLPVVLALGGNFAFKMHGRLPDRPLFPLDEQLKLHGGTLKKEGDTLHVSGKLSGGIFELPGDVSSQFITGLLLALPLLDTDSEIRISGCLESVPYIDMTRDVQKKFGIESRFENNVFYIKGNQSYSAPESFSTEGDWSNGAFWLCANALTDGKVNCTNLDVHSVQGDKAVVDILKNLPCTVDARNIPDLIPAISAVAAVTPGTTRVINAKRLIIKESDRLQAVYAVLHTLGADITKTDDGLIINGKEALNGGTVDAHNDHRIAMMASIAAIVCKKSVTITCAEAVSKSYPDFWKDYQMLGAKIKEEL